MKKYIFLISVFYLAACAGNPPAWWDPSNRYSEPNSASLSNTTVRPNPQVRSSVPTEETISFETDTADFEEMAIPEEADENQAALSAQENLTPSLLESH